VTTASIDTTSVGVGLKRGSVKCSGGSKNITIQGGPALEAFSGGWQGAAYVKNVQLPGSTMTLRGEVMVVADSTFAGLQSFGDAAIVFAASNVTFINTTFVTSNNSAAGCIYANESSSLAILDSNFTNNFGLAAGAAALWNSTAAVNNTVFNNNTGNSAGGALFVYNGTDVLIQQSTFANNNATNGGAVFLERCSSVTMTQNSFEQNSASKSGGAVFQLQCPGTMLSNTFVQNSGSNGGAVWQNNVKKVNHTLNLFVGNSAPKGSGGIELNQVDAMSVTNCNFTLGTGSKGGAIYTQNTAGDVVSSYFGNNSVTTNGGAIFRGTSTGDITDNYFYGNSASLDGGAIYDSHVMGAITNNTFTLASSRNSSITGIFRTVCSGSISNNKGLPSAQIANQQPVG